MYVYFMRTHVGPHETSGRHLSREETGKLTPGARRIYFAPHRMALQDWQIPSANDAAPVFLWARAHTHARIHRDRDRERAAALQPSWRGANTSKGGGRARALFGV